MIPYGPCATLVDEGERENDSKMERSMLRGTVGEPRGAGAQPNRVRLGAVAGGDGVDCNDGSERPPTGASMFHGKCWPGAIVADADGLCSALCRESAAAAAATGSKMSDETKGELRERRRIDARHENRR